MHRMPVWDAFFIGLIFGALAMRCVMVHQWLHWFKTNDAFRGTKTLDNRIRNEGDAASGCPNWAVEYPVSEVLKADHDGNDPDTPPVAENVQPISEPLSLEESLARHAARNETMSCNSGGDMLFDHDEIELEDLDQLEDCVYGELSDTIIHTEAIESRTLLQDCRSQRQSIDVILRPIQNMLAPTFDYQPMDYYTNTAAIHADALADREEIFNSLIRVLGRFAIRQDNTKLLKVVCGNKSSTGWDQEELWQFLEVAIEYKAIGCFKYLLPSVYGEAAMTRMLELCAFHDMLDMMKEAFDWWSDFVRTSHANFPLVVAATRGHLKSVRFLLAKCTDVETRAKSSFVAEQYATSVLAASARGHNSIVQELVAAGTKLRFSRLDQITVAIGMKNAIMLAFLIEYDRSILTDRSESLLEVLHIAVDKNHPQLVRLALAEWAKANLRQQPSLGALLQVASQRGYLEIMHALMNYGADAEVILTEPLDGPFSTCGQWHARKRHTLIVKLLQEHCSKGCHLQMPDTSSIVSRLAWLGDAEGLERLLAAEPNIDLNGTEQDQSSPLFHAMYNHMRWPDGYLDGTPKRWLKTIRMLLLHGAKLNLKDGQFWADHYRGILKELLADLRDLARW